MAKARVPDTTAPSADYERAARYLAEGRTREEVEAMCPGVDLHHQWIRDQTRDVEAAARATRSIDGTEIVKRLLEIAEGDDTSVEVKTQIYLRLLDRT